MILFYLGSFVTVFSLKKKTLFLNKITTFEIFNLFVTDFLKDENLKTTSNEKLYLVASQKFFFFYN
jgi:hypothetical protein